MSRLSRRPQLTLAMPESLQVLDMGLDFRSYLSRVDENDVPILGNVISYPAGKVADVFEPTVGLLVTILHLYAQSGSSASAALWLRTYDTVQKVFLEQVDSNLDSTKFAREAREVIDERMKAGLPSDGSALCQHLLILLDFQSGIRGLQAPSQRKVTKEPKGAFCNLHLADHKCYQEFACNQLHLHEAGPVRHRMVFFQHLCEVLMKENRKREEILHRVKDSVFFARYGNKVTVRCHGSWIPFFKTVYTDGRLEQAFRLQQYSCNDTTCTNEHCRGIHPQDRRTSQSTKPMDLHNASAIKAELDEEAEHIVSTVENNPKSADNPQPASLTSPPMLSPTAELWRSTVRDYVRQTGIPQVEADESLLRTLQDTKITSTPLSSATADRMTPLLDELDAYGFNSSVSSTDGEPRH